jgi:hypothetical protein
VTSHLLQVRLMRASEERERIHAGRQPRIQTAPVAPGRSVLTALDQADGAKCLLFRVRKSWVFLPCVAQSCSRHELHMEETDNGCRTRTSQRQSHPTAASSQQSHRRQNPTLCALLARPIGALMQAIRRRDLPGHRVAARRMNHRSAT